MAPAVGKLLSLVLADRTKEDGNARLEFPQPRPIGQVTDLKSVPEQDQDFLKEEMQQLVS